MSASFITGSSASLRPSGIGRYFGAAFLTAWLTGWLIGELVALAFLVFLVRSVAGSVAGSAWPIPGGEWIAGGGAWVTWSRREWRVRNGELTAHTTFLTWQRERSFRSGRLEVALWTDSDSDDRYTLDVIDSQGKRTIATEINDEADTVDLGRWLSARTGFPLTLPRQLQ